MTLTGDVYGCGCEHPSPSCRGWVGCTREPAKTVDPHAPTYPPVDPAPLVAAAQELAQAAGVALAGWNRRLRLEVLTFDMYGNHDPAPVGRRCGWYPERPRRRPTATPASRWPTP